MNESLAIENGACRQSTLLEIKPGRLIKLGETLRFETSGSGKLRLCRGLAFKFDELMAIDLTADEAWNFKPTEAGMYLAEFEIDGQWLRRPIAVIERGWSVCQITVGAFTAEDFAGTLHEAGINADYYIVPPSPGAEPQYTFSDPRWVHYEREFGDAIYPHVMANNFGALEGSLSCEDANWDSMSMEGIMRRLQFLQEWWLKQGFRPLDRIASYTPCNRLVEAMKQCGIRILHSVIPEQNWSDGEWSINHWGMPTCPFWIAPDDFRKAGERTPHGVLAMTMNHYHVLLPHLTMWGDFVLSPSHFTRWIRAADSGDESTRYKQFLSDTLCNWASLSDDPFFFSAGHEFGRTFGTANMTEYNRRGLEALIDLSKTKKLAFATGNDVLAYYDRHQPRHPETAFRQRDYWVGVTVNNKPGQAGDSVVIERRDYKAVIRENEFLPFFHYDYLVKWSFTTRDMKAPHDFAPEDKQQLSVHREGNVLHIEAMKPLARTIPVAIWDAIVDNNSFSSIRLPQLEDKREVSVVEIPAGWSGKLSLEIKSVSAPLSRRNDIWKMQTFGEGPDRHTYVHLDAALTQNISVNIELKKKARVDSATGTLGLQGPGVLNLEFGLLQGWYRFWQCGIEDIVPDESVQQKLTEAKTLVSSDWQSELEQHQERLENLASAHMKPGEKIVYQLYCGAQLPLGTRSRAGDYDQVTVGHPTLHAHEKADGVIAFGPGSSFWYHPRHMPFRIDGFPKEHIARRWKVLLHTFDLQKLNARYRVVVGSREAGIWTLPTRAYDEGAFFEIELKPGDVDDRGQLSFHIKTEQTQLLHWWKDKGFIAAIHALWIIEI